MVHVLAMGEVMKLFFLCSLMLAFSAHAAEDVNDPFSNATMSEAKVKAMQRQVDPAIYKAVVDALKIDVQPVLHYQSIPAYSSINSTIMMAAFIEAKVPDCLHSEGLKRQPTFLLTGYVALPFIAVAKLRGKCI